MLNIKFEDLTTKKSFSEQQDKVVPKQSNKTKIYLTPKRKKKDISTKRRRAFSQTIRRQCHLHFLPSPPPKITKQLHSISFHYKHII